MSVLNLERGRLLKSLGLVYVRIIIREKIVFLGGVHLCSA